MADETWMGYVCANGSVGIRNKISVIYMVECSVFVVKKIMGLVDDSKTEVVGFSGCTDSEYAACLPISLIRHPNIGGVLVVGLRREYVQPRWLTDIATKEEKEAVWMFTRDQGDTRNPIDQGLAPAKHMKRAMENTPGGPVRFGDLVIGAEYGGSDFTDGLAGNVVVGRLFDQLMDVRGTAVFGETAKAAGLKYTLVGRAVRREAAEDPAAIYDKALEYRQSAR